MQRVLKGERVTDLCREFGISRKTGDKLKQRFLRLGMAGLEDQSRAPHVIPHKTPPEVEEIILAERRQHPTWGPKKLKKSLERRLNRSFPANSTIENVLLRNGVMERGKSKPRPKAPLTGLRVVHQANEVWCIDYKGQFRLGDRSLCYPLTITDQFSRYILGCEAMGAISGDAAREACEETFRTRGIPLVIRSDNGSPFASNGLWGLSKLSAYWLRRGITLERIRPGHPEENGRHERMHRTLKFETARPARTNLLQQQERFDEFVEEFNNERPHEAIDMKTPADLYENSPRPYSSKLPDPHYPEHEDVLRVGKKGEVRFSGRSVHLTEALAEQHVGIREEPDGRWIVTFMTLDLGHFLRNRTFVPITPSIPPEAD